MTQPEREGEPSPEEPGGEAACALHRVCERCGALEDGPPSPTCPRCGTARAG